MKFQLNPKNTLILSSIFSIVIVACGYLVYSRMGVSDNPLQPQVQNVSDSTEEQKVAETEYVLPVGAELDLAFFGDIFWGRYIHDWSLNSPLGYEYPFHQLRSIPKKENEFWVGNLECPITDQDLSSQQQENLLKFNCRPEYLPYAQEYFDAFSLANNHTDNMEEFNGYNQTKQYLETNSIQHFGHYDNEINNICRIIEVSATPRYSPKDTQELDSSQVIEQYSQVTIPVAFCGYHGVFRTLTADEINKIAEFAEYLPVISMPHSGAEYVTTPDGIKTSTYRAMIDAGADVVIGGHPHAVQSTEIYNNKLIVYSQGNFIFDQQFNRQVTTHLGIRMNIDIQFDSSVEEWQKLPSSCYDRTLICSEIMTLSNPKPEYTITYEPFYTRSDNKITRLATDEITIQYINSVSGIQATLTSFNN